MKEEKSKQKNQQLQAEINGLLHVVGHVFDEFSEYYSSTTDSMNHLDIDIILKTEAIKKREPVKKPVQRITPQPVQSTFKQVSFPSTPKKVIRAMPEEMQQLMRGVRFDEKKNSKGIFGILKWS